MSFFPNVSYWHELQLECNNINRHQHRGLRGSWASALTWFDEAGIVGFERFSGAFDAVKSSARHDA